MERVQKPNSDEFELATTCNENLIFGASSWYTVNQSLLQSKSELSNFVNEKLKKLRNQKQFVKTPNSSNNFIWIFVVEKNFRLSVGLAKNILDSS